MPNDTVKETTDAAPMSRGRLYGWIFLHLFLIIMLPFFLLESTMMAWGNSFLASEPARFTLAIMVVLALTLDVLLPIPASLVSLAASVVIGGVYGATALFIGLMCGSLFGYFVGRFARESLLRRLLMPRTRAELTLLSGGKGVLMLILARPVPVLAEASVMLAGIERYPFQRFLELSLLANVGVTLLYMGAASVAGA